MKKNLNQKLINLIEYYNLINANLLLSDVPLKRTSLTITGTSFEWNKIAKTKNSKRVFNL